MRNSNADISRRKFVTTASFAMGSAGQVVQVSGRVMNLRGEPVRNVRMEIWQANTHGRYAHASDPHTELPIDPDFQGYAVLRTDRDGRYAFTTIKPGPYPTARRDRQLQAVR